MHDMKAVGFYGARPQSDANRLEDVRVGKPTPEGRDLLVKVKAVSVNPVDLMVLAGGNSDPSALKLLGWDAAGVVEAVGPLCESFKPGDEVYYAGDLNRPGCFSEYHLVDEHLAGRKPAALDFAEAAALPLTSITAWEALFHRMNISRDVQANQGKSILVIGSAGGVGSIATQLAAMAGLTVIGTSSRPESADWTRRFGASHVIDHREAFKPQLEALGIGEANYILCLNAIADHWSGIADAIAPQGKICSIVPANGPVPIDALFYKSVSFHWELMFTRSMFHTSDVQEQQRLLNEIADLIDAGVLKTTIAERMGPINAANLGEAHRRLATKGTLGKLTLEGF